MIPMINKADFWRTVYKYLGTKTITLNLGK